MGTQESKAEDDETPLPLRKGNKPVMTRNDSYLLPRENSFKF